MAILLDQHCANFGTPVRLGDINPYQFKVNPMDGEWLDSLASGHQFWASVNPSFKSNVLLAGGETIDPRLWQLRDGLVEFGGQEVCLPAVEEDLSDILSRGQLWGPTGAMMEGRACACHENSCFLWEANQDKLFIATGYALSADGLWRQHSWCVQPTEEGSKIIETTVERELYFGFVLTLSESIEFASDNTDLGAEINDNTKTRYEELSAL